MSPTYNIITFSTAVTFFKEKMVEASVENIKAARVFLDKIDATGGTAIDEALREGVKMLAAAENLPMILFLTDGLPTVGVTDIEEILKSVREHNKKKKARLFVFGVGYDVNTKLLDRLSEDGKGVCEYVQPSESIEVKVSNLYGKIANPVFSDIAVNYHGVRAYDTYPRILPDIFKGSQLIILGRYEDESKKGKHQIHLKGKVAGKDKEYIYQVTYGEKKSADFITRLWAMRKVGYLLDQIRLHGKEKELITEVARLAKKYGIVTPYTSFLVVEEGTGMSPSQVRESTRMLRYAQEQVQSSFKTEHIGRLSQMMSRAAGDYKGKALYDLDSGGERFDSFLEEDMQHRRIEGLIRIKTRCIGPKTFLLKSGVWCDSEYEDKSMAKITEVKFLSKEYFSLIRKYPVLAKYFAIGDNLILCWQEKVYKIVR